VKKVESEEELCSDSSDSERSVEKAGNGSMGIIVHEVEKSIENDKNEKLGGEVKSPRNEVL